MYLNFRVELPERKKNNSFEDGKYFYILEKRVLFEPLVLAVLVGEKTPLRFYGLMFKRQTSKYSVKACGGISKQC